MEFEIERKWRDSGPVDLTIDGMTMIRLHKADYEKLFDAIDEDLHFGETRSDLSRKINELQDELSETREDAIAYREWQDEQAKYG